jgi:H+/Cl- antiporter ClcA
VKKLVEWLAKLPERSRTILKTCACGLVAGLVAVFFQLATNGCYHAGIVRLSHCSHATFLWSSLGLIVGTSLISGWLLNSFCTDAAGSGIPQLKAAFWKNFGYARPPTDEPMETKNVATGNPIQTSTLNTNSTIIHREIMCTKTCTKMVGTD